MGRTTQSGPKRNDAAADSRCMQGFFVHSEGFLPREKSKRVVTEVCHILPKRPGDEDSALLNGGLGVELSGGKKDRLFQPA